MTHSRFLTAAAYVLSILAFSIQSIEAQDHELSTKLSQFVGENGRKYIQPAISSFSADLNSGIFQSADVHGLFGFEVDLVTMFAPVPNDKKTFQATLPDTIVYQKNIYLAGRDYDRSIVTSTALGSDAGAKVFTRQGTPIEVFQFPGGTGLKLIPLVTPQLKVGALWGTEVILRYLPAIKLNDDVGKLNVVGIGAKHSISQWLPGPSLVGASRPGEFPIDISAGLMYQELTLKDTSGGDFIKTKAFNIGVQASKTILLLTIYGGIGYESATTNISYNYRPASEFAGGLKPLSVKLENIKADNTIRITGGLKLHALFFDVFADYSVASQPVASAGLAISF
jgi:hypothetical protein